MSCTCAGRGTGNLFCQGAKLKKAYSILKAETYSAVINERNSSEGQIKGAVIGDAAIQKLDCTQKIRILPGLKVN